MSEDDNIKKLICLSVVAKEVKNFEDFNIKDIELFYNQAKAISTLDGMVVLQKCNAIEIYVLTDQGGSQTVTNLWRELSSDPDKFDPALISQYVGDKCIEHLLQPACGLKSVVLGDSQVLGQVNNAYKLAIKYKMANPVLLTLFSKVRDEANDIRKVTNIGKGYASVSRASVDLFVEQKLDKKTAILVIGAGEVSSLVTKCLYEKGFLNVTVANRTIEEANKLVNSGYASKAILLDEAYDRMENFQTVFSAISVSIAKIVATRLKFHHNLVFFDLGNPRNTLYFPKNLNIVTINEIQDYAQKIIKNREKQIETVNHLIRLNIHTISEAILRKNLNLEIQKNYQWINHRIDKDFIRDYSAKNEFQHGIRDYLYKNKFIEVQTPCVVAVPTDPIKKGVDQETFHLNWYGRKMFLRQSNQLHKQMLVLGGFDKIFELGPFWRSESKFTPRHLAEAWGLDVELAHVKTVEELLIIIGELMHYATTKLAAKKMIPKSEIVKIDFPRIKYAEAVRLIKKYKIPYIEGTDLDYEVEQELAKIVKDKYKTDIFAVTHYPDTIKKFYTKNLNHQTETFDVFYYGWEISSGAVRQDDGIKLKKALSAAGLDIDKYDFYLEKFKNSRPHGGFCLGVDRIISKMLGKDHVKEIVLYPRSQTHIIP